PPRLLGAVDESERRDLAFGLRAAGLGGWLRVLGRVHGFVFLRNGRRGKADLPGSCKLLPEDCPERADIRRGVTRVSAECCPDIARVRRSTARPAVRRGSRTTRPRLSA